MVVRALVPVLVCVCLTSGCCRGEVDADSGRQRASFACEAGEALGYLFFRLTLGAIEAAIRSAWN